MAAKLSANNSKKFIQLQVPLFTILCASFILFIVAGVIVLALIPLYIAPSGLTIDRDRYMVFTTVNYVTNISNTDTLSTINLNSLSTNMENVYNSLSLRLATAKFTETFGIQITQGLCQANFELNGDVMTVSMGIQCSARCFTSRCREICLNEAKRIIADEKSNITVPITFNNLGTYNVNLRFCSFDSFTAEPDLTLVQPFINQLLGELRAQNLNAALYWTYVTIQAGAYDYDRSLTPIPSQAGPTRASRANAMLYGAIYEALAVYNSQLKPVFRPNNLPSIVTPPRLDASRAAVMEAAFQTLSVIYPRQKLIFEAAKNDYLVRILASPIPSAEIEEGIAVGRAVASFIISSRANDGSNSTVNYVPINLPGYHQVDPLHPTQGFLSPNWGSVRPFFLNSGSQFRASVVVGVDAASRNAYLQSNQYFQEYEMIESLGSKDSIARTADQTEIGIFWGYDGAPKIGLPVRLYNQVAYRIALQRGNSMIESARLFALINYAMADSAIVGWESKYFYNFWRPIVGVRNSGTPTIPANPTWEPLGAPADGAGTDFTPGFPSYISGHAVFGSTLFECLRLFYGTDNIPFQFQSDEFNGRTIDSRTGVARPARTRTYQTLSEAEDENKISRVYLGVHWPLDQEEGQIMGHKVARFIFQRFQ